MQDIPQLGFDHNEIMEEAIEVLRRDFEVYQVGLELLPEKFTLSQLQNLYEIILNRKLDKRNFRKKVIKERVVTPLDEKQKGVLHKPAQLFELNAEILRACAAMQIFQSIFFLVMPPPAEGFPKVKYRHILSRLDAGGSGLARRNGPSKEITIEIDWAQQD